MRKAIALVAAIVVAVAPVRARAQSLQGVRVRADNDAFDFWMSPGARPDEEYTSGVRGSLEYTGATSWARWLGVTLGPCRAGAGEPCAKRSYALGQDIYTPPRASDNGAPVPGMRPAAGWLYVEESNQLARVDRLDEVEVTLGVTGNPSLAQYTQRFAHSFVPAFTQPVDWSRQLPFEPGFMVRYSRTQRAIAVGDRSWFGFDVEPHASAALGTILTEASVGLRARAGFAMRHPWLPASVLDALPEVTVYGDATGRGVLRNEFLAGTMFRRSASVRERPWVSAYEFGATVQWRRLSAAFRVHTDAPEYATRLSAHSWSSIEAGWRLDRP